MPGETPEPNVVEYAARHADTDDESRQAPAGADQTAAQALERFRASDPARSIRETGAHFFTSCSRRSQARAAKTAMARDLLLMPGGAS